MDETGPELAGDMVKGWRGPGRLPGIARPPAPQGPFLEGTTCKPDHCVLLEAGEREVVTESWKPGPGI